MINKKYKPETIRQAVTEHFKTDWILKSTKVNYPKKIACYLLYHNCFKNSSHVREELGYKDHSSAIRPIYWVADDLCIENGKYINEQTAKDVFAIIDICNRIEPDAPEMQKRVIKYGKSDSGIGYAEDDKRDIGLAGVADIKSEKQKED